MRISAIISVIASFSVQYNYNNNWKTINNVICSSLSNATLIRVLCNALLYSRKTHSIEHRLLFLNKNDMTNTKTAYHTNIYYYYIAND